MRNNRHGQGEWECTVARNGTQMGNESDLEASIVDHACQTRILELRALELLSMRGTAVLECAS